MSTSGREKIIIRLIAIFFGIVWIILNSYSVNRYAKTSFSGTKPVGAIATAVGADIAVSWEPVQMQNGLV